MRRLRAACLACVIGVAAAAPPALAAASQPPRSITDEYALKAAHLVNFARFVAWPAAAGEDGFPICVLGDDPFGPLLETTFARQSVGGQRVVARRFTDLDAATRCRVLFVSPSETGRLPVILAALRSLPVLTVSDMARFARAGGMIQFVRSGGRLRFEVDLGPVHEAGLTLSSSLLRVARVVRPGMRL